MKKLFFATLMLISTTILAQSKWSHFSFRAGADKATKGNYTQYANGKLSGLDIGVSYDKYWNWYGIGIDADLMVNNAPTYTKEAEMKDSIKRRSGNAFNYNVQYSISNTNSKLTRTFVGIGPSFKISDKSNKFVLELNTRAGITYTNGGSLIVGTQTLAPFNTPFFNMHLNRSGVIPGTGGLIGWTFRDQGYNNSLLTTLKGQLRASYFFKPNFGVNVGGYYNHYQGSKVKVDYLEYIHPTLGYWDVIGNMKSNLSPLSSYGITLGATYRIGTEGKKKPSTQKAKESSSASILVKDELSGQPVRNAMVTIKGADGKTYTSVSNNDGIAIFTKIADGTYTAAGMLNGVNTDEANFSVNRSKGSAVLTHNDPRFTVVGRAINMSTQKPEGEVVVTLKKDANGDSKLTNTDNTNGNFNFQLDQSSDYTVSGKKDSYLSNVAHVSTKGLNRSQTLYVELQLGIEKVEVGKPLLLKDIDYELNKSNVNEAASGDLERLVQFLNDNPTYKVEIASHTDSRGTNEYNQKLSQDRAQAVVSFITARGVDANRLFARGYGETKLKNNCSDGTTCSEEEHRVNRRTELTLLN